MKTGGEKMDLTARERLVLALDVDNFKKAEEIKV